MSWTEQASRFHLVRELLSSLRLGQGEYDVVAPWVGLVLGIGRLVFFMLCELGRRNRNAFPSINCIQHELVPTFTWRRVIFHD